MNIVISCLLYQHLTGSELYVYDVAHELLRRGHQVRIHASMIGELFQRTDDAIIVSPRTEIPTNTDLIIAQHNIFSEPLIQRSEAPVVYICHSRLYDVEHPIVHPHIRKYVSISQDIHDWMLEEYNLESEVIPNGVDAHRFCPSDEPKEYIFIPGTADKMRIPFMEKLIKEYKNSSEQLLFSGYQTEMLPRGKNITVQHPIPDVEKLYRKAKWVAGLFNGRVQYETWFCGLEFKAFDEHGNEVEVTKPDNLHEQTIEHMVDRILA